MAHGKKYLEAAKLVDRDAVYAPDEAAELAKDTTYGQVRRDGRGPPPARRRPPPRRPDGPRHGRPAARHGQGRPRRRLRPGRQGPGGAPRRRRRGRRRGPRQEDRGRLARVRRRAGDARLDGHGRPARQDPRPARPDAEPQGRARSRSTSSGRSARSRAAGSSSRSTRPRSSTSPFGKASFEADALVDNLAALVDAINRAKPAGAKGQYLKGLTIASTMGPGIRVDIPAGPRGGAPRSGPTRRPALRRPAATIRGDGRANAARRHNRRTTDRQRQPAPAGRDTHRSVTVGA